MLASSINTIRRSIFNFKYRRAFAGQDFHTNFRCDNHEGLNFGLRCYIGPYCHFDALGGIKIDDFSIIGPHVKIWSYNHNFRSGTIPYDEVNIFQPVSIGRGCWIGLGSIILPGASIGEGTIVGAGSVVKGDIPPYSMVRPLYSQHSKLEVHKKSERFYRDIRSNG